MTFLHLFLSGLWTPNLWWWLSVPFAAGMIAFLVKRKAGVPDGRGAWNAVGRQWAGIGWTLLLSVAVVYILSGMKPGTFGFSPVSDLANNIDQKGILASLLVAITQVYAWVVSLLLVGAWGLIAGFIFIAPGNRMAREKLNYK
jgi:hypothetical protein